MRACSCCLKRNWTFIVNSVMIFVLFYCLLMLHLLLKRCFAHCGSREFYPSFLIARLIQFSSGAVCIYAVWIRSLSIHNFLRIVSDMVFVPRMRVMFIILRWWDFLLLSPSWSSLKRSCNILSFNFHICRIIATLRVSGNLSTDILTNKSPP